MAIYKEDIVDINLETGNIHRSFLAHSIGYLDQKADHFGVRVFRGKDPVDLTGVSVQGIFMPPQGSPIAITSGNSVSGNVAYVVLPQACYNYNGQFCLAIKLVDSNNSITGTVRIVDGMVDNTHASGTVAPTSAVPTYQEILSTYDAMVAATAAANGCIAATYSSSSTYAVGDYCIHDGGLYRCTTAITTAEAWTSGHWTAAKFGPDLAAEVAARAAADSDLKSAIKDRVVYQSETNLQTLLAEEGGVKYADGTSNNAASSKAAYYRSDYIPVCKGDRITYFAYSVSTGTAVIAFYNENKEYVQASSVAGTNGSNQTGSVTITAFGYVRLVCNQSNIKQSGNFSIINQSGVSDELLSGRIGRAEDSLEETLTTSGVEWEVGAINTHGTNTSSDVLIRSDFIKAKCSSVAFTVTDGYRFSAVWYNESKDIPCLRDDYWNYESKVIVPPGNASYLRITIGKTEEETASMDYADEIGAVGTLSVKDISDDVAELQEDVNELQEDVQKIIDKQKYYEKTEVINLLTETGCIKSTGVIDDSPDPPVYRHSDYIYLGKGSTIIYTNVRVTNMCAIALYLYPREGEGSYDAEHSAILPGKSSGIWEMPYDGYVRLCCRIAEIESGASFKIQNEIGSDIAELDERLPAYWETEMQTVIPKILANDAAIGSGGDSFIFITDVHIPRNSMRSPKLIKEIMDKTSVDKVFFGGDLLDICTGDTGKADAEAQYALWNNLMRGTGQHFIIGNHDGNNYNSSNAANELSQAEIYGLAVKRVEKYCDTEGHTSYCMDNLSQKMRYILLDTEKTSSFNVLNWMKSKLTELQAGWHVIVMQHRYWGSDTSTVSTQGTNLVNAINSVFSQISATIVAVIVGHTHTDYKINDATNGYPIIAVNCDTRSGTNSGYTRTAGTVSEQSFDVVHVDYANSKIYMTRIGAGSDREFTF